MATTALLDESLEPCGSSNWQENHGAYAAGDKAAEKGRESVNLLSGECSVENSRIMIADDEPGSVMAIRKHLNDFGYQDIIATSKSAEATTLAAQQHPDVIILNGAMAQVSGLDILRAMHTDPLLQSIPVLILTAASDARLKRAAADLGAADVLSKPIDPTELVLRVRNALVNKDYRQRLENYAETMERHVRMQTAQLEESRQQVIHCLARAAEYRDDDTGHHIIRVGRYVYLIARELGFTEDQADLLELAAQLHDVGKIGIPDAILLKPGKLNPEERAQIETHCSIAKHIVQPYPDSDWRTFRKHTRIGANLLLGVRNSPLLMLAARIAQSHHEWWDGTGYPLGFAGEDIPLEGRMTAVADVYDALSSRRPYKPPFPREKCFAILEEGRGVHFDPKVLDAFFKRRQDVIDIQLKYMD